MTKFISPAMALLRLVMKTEYFRQFGVWTVAIMCVFSCIVKAADQPTKFMVPNNQIQAMGIKTIPLQSNSEAVKISFPAEVVVPPTAEQVVSSPVAGLVTQLLVQQNQVVRAGAPLAKIISPEFGQLQLQLLQASTRATLARQTMQREQQLFDEGIIAQRRIQEAHASLSESEATLKQAKAALRLSGMPAATINQVLASGSPQDMLTLVAAKTGVVTEIEVKNGQRVEAATALLHIAQTDKLWLDIQVPVTDSARWKAGTSVKVKGSEMRGRVLSSSAMVGADSQTVILRAELESKVGEVRPGEFLTIELPMAATAGEWDVPLSAVAHYGDKAYVFVRTSNGFEARLVKVVASAGQRVRIQGQLKASEQIAVSSVVALKAAWINAKESK
jgi:RND family efflux transporter MFP subunit